MVELLAVLLAVGVAASANETETASVRDCLATIVAENSNRIERSVCHTFDTIDFELSTNF